MKKMSGSIAIAVLSMSLALSSAQAANWKETYRDNDETNFVDNESVKFTGNRFSIWELRDYSKPHNDAPGSKATFRSRVDQSTGDCDVHGIATTKMYFYEQNMGNGKVVNTMTIPLAMEEAPPGSLGRTLVDYFCKKRSPK